jgi:serine/threonine protein kinase
VMRYIPNATWLNVRAMGGALSLRTVAEVLCTVSAALKKVHETHLLHRDINPGYSPARFSLPIFGF